jgi:pectate lyase
VSSLTRQIHFYKALDLFLGCGGAAVPQDYWHQEVISYYFKEQVRPDGLINWGGHVFIDPLTRTSAGPRNKLMEHELKDTFPDYSAMFKIHPENTLKFLTSFWQSHAVDAGALIVSRHGSGVRSETPFDFHDIADDDADEPIYSSRLTFVNAANDLLYAAISYFEFTGNRLAIKAAKSLSGRYLRRRHKKTGLGVYMYTIPLATDITNDETNTMSWYGDRAQRQFGPEFGQQALEMNLLLERHVNSLYGEQPLMLFAKFFDLGEPLRELAQDTCLGLEAFCQHIYDSKTGRCRPLFINGVSLSGFVLPRSGYYGKKGAVLRDYPIPPKVASSVFLAALVFESPILIDAARSMFSGLGLGVLGESLASPQEINLRTTCADPNIALCLVNAYRFTGNERFMALAECVIDRMIRATWYEPFFRPSVASAFAVTDAVQPMVLSYFLSVSQGRSIPMSITSASSIYGDYFLEGRGVVNLVDSSYFWSAIRI